MKKTLFSFCAAVFFMMLMTYNVWAAEQKDSVSLPVTQTVISYSKDIEPNRIVGYYTFTAEDKDSPMSVGTENGMYQFTITGNGSYLIPNIKVTQQGIWNYSLTVKSQNNNLHSETINITLYAKENSENFDTMFVAKLANGEKCDLSFNVTEVGDVFPGDNEVEKQESSSQIPESNKPAASVNSTSPHDMVSRNPKPGFPFKTGDSSHTGVYLIAFAVSAVLLVLLTYSSKNNNNTKRDND